MRAIVAPCDDAGCGWIAGLPDPGPARRLSGQVRADCVVVGAGFTGLAIARELATQRPSWRVIVVEAQRVGYGGSGRNSGFLVDVPHYDPRRGVEGNRRLVRLGRAGCAQLRELVRRHEIECEWSERGRVHAAIGDAAMRDLETYRRGLELMGEAHECLDRSRMAALTGTTHYRAGVRTPGGALVQPAALARGLGATLPGSVEVYEKSPVLAIHRNERFGVETAEATVTADRLFLGTNGYTVSLGLLKKRVFPLMTFGSLTRVLSSEERAALGGESEWGLVSEAPMGTTVRRTRDQRILIRNTVRYAGPPTLRDRDWRRIRENHRRALEVRFPTLGRVDFEYTWGGVMGASINGTPFFGQLDRNCFAVAGYNGVGVALGTVAGHLLADLALGVESELLKDMQSLSGPGWIPPDPFLGAGVRATLAWMARRARAEQ